MNTVERFEQDAATVLMGAHMEHNTTEGMGSYNPRRMDSTTRLRSLIRVMEHYMGSPVGNVLWRTHTHAGKVVPNSPSEFEIHSL